MRCAVGLIALDSRATASDVSPGEAEQPMKHLFARFIREDEGQDIIEYGLLAAFISIVAWLTLQAIGQDVTSMFSDVKVGDWQPQPGRSFVEQDTFCLGSDHDVAGSTRVTEPQISGRRDRLRIVVDSVEITVAVAAVRLRTFARNPAAQRLWRGVPLGTLRR